MAQTAAGWNDAQSLVAAVDPEFERLHPRGGDGRFIPKPGGWIRYLDALHGLWVKATVETEEDKQGNFKVKDVIGGAEHLKKRSELFSTPQPKAILKPSDMTKSADQSRSGSNTGSTFEDKDGDKWYVKTPQSKLHAANENLANRLYREAGAAAPETAVSPDGSNFMTKIEKSDDWHVAVGRADDEEQKKILDAIGKDFVIDAWLANWDAPVNDNLRITPEGVPLRVDSGGSVMFRARGGKRDLGPMVGELKSMRDPATNRDGARAYANVTRDVEVETAKRILAVSPARIKEMVHEDGLPASTADALIARRAYIATHYSLALPETTIAGKNALDDLAAAKTDADAAERARKAVVKSIVRMAPDAAVTLSPGAPVWVKDKKDPNIVTSGNIPDIMLVDAASNPEDFANSSFFWLKSRDGRIKTGNVPRSALEPLRENFASESAEYKTGERPQIGDLVEIPNSGGEKGVLAELYPLYGKVVKEDGESKVVRIKSSKLLAKSGTHDLAKANAEGEVVLATKIANEAGPDIGPLADVTNPIANFPLVAFSLPHRANVLVLSYDHDNERATVMLGDFRKVTVPANKLYDDEKVDRAKIDAMPVRQRGQRAPNTNKKDFVAFDTSKLETKTDWRVNSNVIIKEFKPGDRLIKAKNESTNQILFFRIKKDVFSDDRQIEFVGGSKGSRRQTQTTDFADYVMDAYKNNPSWIWNQLQNSTLVDATPAKYDQAAWEADHDKKLNLRNLVPPKETAKMSAYRLDDSVDDDPTLSYQRNVKATGKEWSIEIPTREGQIIHVLPDPGGKLLGVTYKKSPIIFRGKAKKDDNGNKLWERRQLRVPRFVVERNGLFWDAGPGGEFLDNPSKQTQIDPLVWKAYQDTMVDGYWSQHYDDVVPTVEMPWGKFDYVDYTDAPTFQQVQDANTKSTALTGLAGKLPTDKKQRGWYIKWAGDESLLEHLKKDAVGWDKGSLEVKKSAHDTAEEQRLARVAASKFPTGTAINETADLDALLPGTLIKTELTKEGRDQLVSTVHGGDASKLTDDEVTVYSLKKDDGKWVKAMQLSSGEWFPANGLSDDGVSSTFLAVPPKKLGEMTVEKTPGAGSGVGGAGDIPDVTSVQGFDALTHKIETSREKVMAGEYDKRLDEIMRTDYDAGQQNVGYRAFAKISDGTVHADPRMAQFVLDHGGNKKSLVVPGSVFKAITDVTGADMNNWRFVTSADQRDAIKYGDHFNGTGASGNGVYSGPRSAASGYGSAGAQITMRPGGKAVENGDAALGSGEDIARSTRERHDLLAQVTKMADTEMLTHYDPLTSQRGRDIKDQLKTQGKSDEDIDKTMSLAAFKAAISVSETAKEAGWTPSVTAANTSYYNTVNAFTVEMTSPDGHKVIRLVFRKPVTSGTRGWGAQQAEKIDPKVNFNMVAEWVKKPDDIPKPAPRRNYGAYSASGTFYDDTTEIMDTSGLLSDIGLPGREKKLQDAIKKARQIDSRISFISDPGRWALAAGYDNMTVPSSNFNIFLHRTAFVIKK